jgi:hypothetical protein
LATDLATAAAAAFTFFVAGAFAAATFLAGVFAAGDLPTAAAFLVVAAGLRAVEADLVTVAVAFLGAVAFVAVVLVTAFFAAGLLVDDDFVVTFVVVFFCGAALAATVLAATVFFLAFSFVEALDAGLTETLFF